jgi:predicted nucleic acid-binding protein
VTLLCDTSVLIAAMVKEHPEHLASFQLIQAVKHGNQKEVVATHTVAECYAVLTALPKAPLVVPSEAREVIRKVILDLFDLIDLNSKDYEKAIDWVAEKNLKSGAIFDALIAHAALKKKIPNLITWNVKHFDRFSSGDLKVITPADF